MSVNSALPGGRKRAVNSCLPCHTKKRKCNRRRPCDHCTRRRRPENCIYHGDATSNAVPASQGTSSRSSPTQYETESGSEQGYGVTYHAPYSMEGRKPALNEIFGYFEDTGSNVMGLLRRMEPPTESPHHDMAETSHFPPEAWDIVQQELSHMPERPIIDFLVRYFVENVDWMDQIVCTTKLLTRYEKWWGNEVFESIQDVEFGVLLMRICAYATQFLPSPSHTIDHVCGIQLVKIRSMCNRVGDKLAVICTRLDSKGSLLRVQHLLFTSLRLRSEGKMNEFWKFLSCTIWVAQRIGVHRAGCLPTLDCSNDHLDKKSRRDVYCCLYIWDSRLSLQLERPPFLPRDLVNEFLAEPLNRSIHNSGAPEVFTERLLQTDLARFWRGLTINENQFDLTAAQELYEKFCSEFLPSLHAAFSYPPETKWDSVIPLLAIQRQRYHLATLYYVCRNFRPVLLLSVDDIASLPAYKQVLVQTQTRVVVTASLRVVDATATLHTLLGGSHIRFVDIVTYAFEAAVILIYVCATGKLPNGDGSSIVGTSCRDPLDLQGAHVTGDTCLQSVRNALDRLRMLAGISEIAEAGARCLGRLLDRLPQDRAAVSVMDIRATVPHSLPTFDMTEGLQGMPENFTEQLLGDPIDTSFWDSLVSTTLPDDIFTDWNHNRDALQI